MWNVAEDGALVEIYKSSNLAASCTDHWGFCPHHALISMLLLTNRSRSHETSASSYGVNNMVGPGIGAKTCSALGFIFF